jgi:type IV secretory pathway VirB2 component (pilin)
VGAFGARLTHGQEVLVAKGRVTSVISSLKGAIAFIVNVILAIVTCCKGSRAALVGLSRGGTIIQHNTDISAISHFNSII